MSSYINDLVKDTLVNELHFEFPDLSKEITVNLKDISNDGEIDDNDTAKILQKVKKIFTKKK